MEEIKSGRSVGIDIIKAMSVLFVLCVHFSLNTKFYSTPINDANMFTQSCLRWLFYAGVPLFLMCTGYLNYKKTVSRSYYLKVFRVLIPFVLISIICLFIKKRVGDDPFDFQKAVFSIFNFKADSYSWYVNMYIGLFLMAPLLNAAINALDQKKLRILICALIFVISLPTTFNPLFTNIKKISYFLFPNWWQGFYPILYYFIGSYIAKYQIKIRKSICAAVLVFMLCLQTVMLILVSHYKLNNWFLSDYSSLLVIVESLSFFLLFYSVNVKSRFIKFAFKWVSILTLEIYLFSNITDSYIYPYFENHYYGSVPPMTQQEIFIKNFLVIITLTFLSSLVMSLIFHTLCVVYGKCFKYLMKKDKVEEKTIPENINV